jgi:hypothetical protein
MIGPTPPHGEVEKILCGFSVFSVALWFSEPRAGDTCTDAAAAAEPEAAAALCRCH